MASSRSRDLNVEVAGELYDIALVSAERFRKIAYKRAAQAVLALEEPLDVIAARQPLSEIRFIGPACERIIVEYLEQGKSPTVERAIERSGQRDQVAAAHALRTNFLSRAGALQLLHSRARGAITAGDYKGDLQVHSRWSDGSESIAQLAEAAMARGHRYLGISDHSYGLKIARGVSMEDIAEQHREIDALNRRWAGRFRVFKAIEANIPAEGGVDLTEDDLAQFEIVLAAPHSKLRKAEDQTERMIATVRHPGVHVLAHPRGRMYSRRGLIARWDEVFEQASRCDVVVEIDGDPYRQDLDYSIAKRALDAGCLFALDSDAHAGDELVNSEFALAHARYAGIPPERVVNAWPPAKLLAWAHDKTRARRRAATL